MQSDDVQLVRLIRLCDELERAHDVRRVVFERAGDVQECLQGQRMGFGLMRQRTRATHDAGLDDGALLDRAPCTVGTFNHRAVWVSWYE